MVCKGPCWETVQQVALRNLDKLIVSYNQTGSILRSPHFERFLTNFELVRTLSVDSLELKIDLQVQEGSGELYIGQVDPNNQRCGYGYVIIYNSDEISLQEGLYSDSNPIGMTRTLTYSSILLPSPPSTSILNRYPLSGESTNPLINKILASGR